MLGGRAAPGPARRTGSCRSATPASLGGFLNLSGLRRGQLRRRRRCATAQLRAERIIGRLPLGLRGDMRARPGAGGRQASAGLHTETARRGWLDSASALPGRRDAVRRRSTSASATTSDGATNAYLFIGTP
ncbi:MAG: hypothetical protein MZW92_65170 [Comamonadaceae bacterium]|nr:hypothetical protein [Comamonadaceae bacterium]